MDGRGNELELSPKQIAGLCHRRFGIGADGVMVLHDSEDHDFDMKYFNADGYEGSMCGNGGRCIAAYAFSLGIFENKTEFTAIDGIHKAFLINATDQVYQVEVSLNDVEAVKIDKNDFYILNTGSPHYVEFVENLAEMDVFEKGKLVRWDDRFQPEGINANFVEHIIEQLYVRTFERGVENITLSCGTGVTAAAIAASVNLPDGEIIWPVKTDGGNLEVRFIKEKNHYSDVWLKGPATRVFEGTIEV